MLQQGAVGEALRKREEINNKTQIELNQLIHSAAKEREAREAAEARCAALEADRARAVEVIAQLEDKTSHLETELQGPHR